MKPLNAPAPTSQPRELVPEGTYIARIYRLLELGEFESTFKDTFGNPIVQKKIDITFELPFETRDFGGVQKPMVISQEYTLAVNDKANLRALIHSVENRAIKDDEAERYDILSIVGKPLQIQIIHKTSASGNTYVKVEKTLGMTKGSTCPEQFNGSQILTYDNWSEELFQSLPKFIKEKMEGTLQYKQMKNRVSSPSVETSGYKPDFAELRKPPVDGGQSMADTAREFEEGKVNVDDIPF